MSCASETYSSTIVDSPRLTGHSSSVLTPLSGFRARETANHPLEQSRSQLTASVIPDSTRADPEYVWGDEGPIND
jgi:hypothetical protein